MIPVLRALLLRGADSFVVFSKLPGQKIRQSLKEANIDGSKASVYPVRGELVQASDLDRASFARARGVIFLQEGFAKTISDFVMMRSLHVLYPNNKIDSQTVVLELKVNRRFSAGCHSVRFREGVGQQNPTSMRALWRIRARF
ncbi:MAG: hypothetical protein VW959_02400 [Aquiluna sp.]